MKGYKILNELFEQPFLKKTVEIAKFFKLQKTYWGLATIIIIFIIGQIIGLINGDKIESFTQLKLSDNTINIFQEVFWHIIEYVLANFLAFVQISSGVTSCDTLCFFEKSLKTFKREYDME